MGNKYGVPRFPRFSFFELKFGINSSVNMGKGDMMRIYIHFLIAVLAVASLPFETASANGPDVQWEKTFGGSGWDYGNSVQQTTDGGFIIAGGTEPFGAGSRDVYLIKTDPNGNLQWQKTFGGSDSDSGSSVQQTTDGGFIIAGGTRSFGAGGDDVYLIKTDPNGNLQWQKTFGGSYWDEGHSVQQTADGGYIIAGYYTYSFGEKFYSDVYLIKTDPNGNLQWEKTFDGSDWDEGHSVQQTADGGYIVAGFYRYFFDDGSYSDVYLIKTDPNGNLQWEKTFGGISYDKGYSVQQTTDCGFIITGFTNSFGAGSSDVYLIKTNSDGNSVWQRTFGGIGYDEGHSVQQTADGGYIIAGDTSAGGGDVYLIKLEPEDRDGDGMLDCWETDGIDIDCDGTIDLDLPTLGANPNHKDLFVEVDAMVGRAPAEATLQRVVDKFAAVPNALVNNPDGNDGITLHCLPLDELNIPLADWPNAFADFDDVKTTRFGTPTQQADPNIRAAKAKAYRYCVFANRYRLILPDGTVTWSSSGLAELPGNDFMVTLGGWSTPGGTPDQQAGTFMHELGHNLGLIHGGDQEDPDPNKDHRYNWKPNYHSIMNYTWQFPRPKWGIAASWVLDYSREAFPNLNEANLDEPAGIGGHVWHEVPVGPPPLRIVNETGPVDYNNNGDTNDLAVLADINYLLDDINFDGVVDANDPTPGDVLKGYCDWPNLRYLLYGHPNFQDGVHSPESVHSEMTLEMYLATGGGCRTGDIDCDGHVDFEDFAILGNQWLQTPDFPSADIAPSGGDDMVDFLDLAILAEHWLEGI